MTTRLLGLVSTLFLVRLLLPQDFGLVALAMGLVQAIEGLSDLGVQEAVVREEAPDRTFYDTAFTMNAIRAWSTAAIIALSAGWAAEFFQDARLLPILQVIALSTFLTAFENIGVTEFRRNLTFRYEFYLAAVPRMCQVLVTLALAVVLKNYWALISGIMVSRLLRTAMTYYMHPYRPRFGLGAWRQITGYSAWTWGIGLVWLVRDRSDSMILGRFVTPTQIGIYSVGAEIAALPTTELIIPIARACFSSFAAARNSGINAVETYLRVTSSTCLITLPAGIGLSLVAYPVVRLAFGEKWGDAADLIAVLSISGTLSVFGAISLTLFEAFADLALIFWTSLVTTALRVALLVLLTHRYGLIGAGSAVAVAGAIEQIIYTIAVFRRLELSFWQLSSSIWRSVLGTACMALALYYFGYGWEKVDGAPLEVAAYLGTACVFGGLVYAAVVLSLWLVAGRPMGGEADAIALLRQFAGRCVRRRSR
jgi:lipopolysaccharide exporter